MRGHILVWVDQKIARLFRIDRNSIETAGEGPNQIVHHHDNTSGGRPDDKAFFSDIAGGLTGASGILIVGPGAKRSAFSTWLTERCPDIAGNIWAVAPMDHPTDPQLIAHGKAFFSAEAKLCA